MKLNFNSILNRGRELFVGNVVRTTEIKKFIMYEIRWNSCSTISLYSLAYIHRNRCANMSLKSNIIVIHIRETKHEHLNIRLCTWGVAGGENKFEIIKNINELNLNMTYVTFFQLEKWKIRMNCECCSVVCDVMWCDVWRSVL